MVGMEYLDLNTSVGGSLSENECWKCTHVLMALYMNGGWVYKTWWDRILKLDQTDLVQNVNVRIFGGTDMSTRWDRFHEG